MFYFKVLFNILLHPFTECLHVPGTVLGPEDSQTI